MIRSRPAAVSCRKKKNPDAAELVRGKTGRVVGHLVALLTVMKGLPMAYNKDLQEDKEGLFDTVRTLEKSIPLIGLVLERLKPHPEHMRRAATQGHLNATELADFLVARNLPFRKAHELVGKIVIYALERNCGLEDLRLSEFRKFSRLFTPELYRCLQVDAGLARRREPGGTAPSQVRRALQKFRTANRDPLAEFQPRRYFLVFFDSSCLGWFSLRPTIGAERPLVPDRCNCPAWI